MGSEWRLNPEVKLEAWAYTHTGGIAADPFWHRLEVRRALDPARFDHNHPNIAGFFTPPPVLGMLPHGPVLDDLRHRFEINPDRFTHYHPFWGDLFAHEPHVSGHPAPGPVPGQGTPPPVVSPGPGAIPEPSSIVSLCAGLAIVLACLWRRRAGQ